MKTALGKLLGVAILAGFLFGAFAVIVAPIEMYRMADAKTWPSRKGVITKSYPSRQRDLGRRAWHFKSTICGNYQDTGEQFCIARVRYGDFRVGEGEAQTRAIVKQYPAGTVVDVYYSPRDPRETILEPQASWTKMKILLASGIVFALLPFVLWLFRKELEPERYGRG